MFEAVPELISPHVKLLNPRIRMLHNHPLLRKLLVESALFRRQLRTLHAAFASSRILPLDWQHTVELGIILLYALIAKIQT